ncbi:hypothetical protein [Paenibacillus camelliae]|uniref:hypothetical protein n=1 Tax=Paenibacillus camelliae TaxID=512410 RepID=UPI00203C7F97|nr:hypothetical protein [Paenibacillus camelliae]MCM3632908.1 hypothetical protein [Paenibacillus camelliae]
MGGRDTIKGVKIQGIVAVLNSLTNSDWKNIYIEPEILGEKTDKIDIQWDLCDGRRRLGQVKSSEGLINKSAMKTYLNEMIKETNSSDEFVLYVVGNLSSDASTFVNNLNNSTLDKSELAGYEFVKQRATSVKIVLRAFDFEALESYAYKLLHKFYDSKDIVVRAKDLEQKTSALFHQFDRLPILRIPLSKKELENTLVDWIDYTARGDLDLIERQNLKESVGKLKVKFSYLVTLLYDPTTVITEKLSRLNAIDEFSLAFSLKGVQYRYLDILDELEHFDRKREEMMELYELYQTEKREDFHSPVRSFYAEKINKISSNEIDEKIESESIKEFMDNLEKIYDQLYK